MESTPSSKSIPAELRLQQCPKCGYPLQGLRAIGTCPECGLAYNDGMIVLFGWSAGSRVSAESGTTFMSILCTMGMILPFLPLMISGRWHDPLTAMGFAACALTIGLIIWRRFNRNPELAGCGVRIYFSAAGCGQADDEGQTENVMMTPWEEVGEVMVGELRPGKWRVQFLPVGAAWWKFRNRMNAVDALVQCTPEQGDALHEFIRAHRRGRWSTEVVRRP